VASGYAGAIHFVNPRGGRLFDRPVHTAIAVVPDPVELAVLATPAAATADALRACHARGITAVIVASGGFKEAGPEGAARERALADLARELGVALVGPNCVGTLDTHVPLDTSFLPPPGPRAGPIAFLSHSGAMCGAVIDYANGRGFGLSRMVSLGNQASLNESDALLAAAADPHTKAIALYLEGIGDGPRFVSVAAEVGRRTPVVALKVGRTSAGRRAAASHTGALAGDEAAFDAAFRRAGVLRAAAMEELFDWARALAACPLPRGRRVAVLTNAGGPGVVATDALESLGLVLAPLEDATRAALAAALPPSASVRNPVDMLAAATPALYASCLRTLLADPTVDAVAVMLPPPPMTPPEQVADALIPVIDAATKPVVVAALGGHLVRAAVERFVAGGVAEYRFPEQAASALAALARRAEWLAAHPAHHAAASEPPAVRFDVARRAIADAPAGWLGAEATWALLEAAGIEAVGTLRAATADAAAAAAHAAGFPVVLKVDSPDLPHKSDVGGVLLDVGDEDAARRGFDTMLAAVKAARPDARIHGVTVQRQVPAGQDLIVGCVRDAQFGPLAMVGGGGVEVEGMRDVAFGLAPLPTDEAAAMLGATWAGRRLHGFRNLAPADRGAAQEALVRLSYLAAALPRIAEIEVNPLRVLAAEQGAVALDARVRLTTNGGDV
jgi:acetyltransferase